MRTKNLFRIILLMFTSLTAGASLAGKPPIIGELSKTDLQFMAEQRQSIQDLAAINLGRQFSGDKERDLDLLQTLLDRKLVRADQVRELQAMGVIMGDLLAADLDMHWIIYEDAEGRSRALRYAQSDNYLFPMTMIARRREVGNETSVKEIYQKAYDIINDIRPALPFQ